MKIRSKLTELSRNIHSNCEPTPFFKLVEKQPFVFTGYEFAVP